MRNGGIATLLWTVVALCSPKCWEGAFSGVRWAGICNDLTSLVLS